MSPRRALGLVLAAALVLGIWGLRWGLPSEFGWAPDEVLPADVEREGLSTPVIAAHVNHGLRGAESDADAEFVRAPSVSAA